MEPPSQDDEEGESQTHFSHTHFSHTVSHYRPFATHCVRVDGQGKIYRVMKDRISWYLRSENTSYDIIRPKNPEDSFDIIGEVIAVQRVFENPKGSPLQ